MLSQPGALKAKRTTLRFRFTRDFRPRVWSSRRRSRVYSELKREGSKSSSRITWGMSFHHIFVRARVFPIPSSLRHTHTSFLFFYSSRQLLEVRARARARRQAPSRRSCDRASPFVVIRAGRAAVVCRIASASLAPCLS